MKFEIKERIPLSKSVGPLCEDYDMEEMSDYAGYLSTVMIHGVVGNATEIGSGVFIEASGDMQQGQEGIEEMKTMSSVFRQALRLAIERDDEHAEFFQKILDDYTDNGICLPFMEPFFEDENGQAQQVEIGVGSELYWLMKACFEVIAETKYEGNPPKITPEDIQVAVFSTYWNFSESIRGLRRWVEETGISTYDNAFLECFQNVKQGYEQELELGLYTAMKNCFEELAATTYKPAPKEKITLQNFRAEMSSVFSFSENFYNLNVVLRKAGITAFDEAFAECFHKVKQDYLKEYAQERQNGVQFYVVPVAEGLEWAAKNRLHRVVDLPVRDPHVQRNSMRYANLLEKIQGEHWLSEMRAEYGSRDFSTAFKTDGYVLICEGPRTAGLEAQDELFRLSQAVRHLFNQELENTPGFADSYGPLCNELLTSYEKCGCDAAMYQNCDCALYDDGTTQDRTEEKQAEREEMRKEIEGLFQFENWGRPLSDKEETGGKVSSVHSLIARATSISEQSKGLAEDLGKFLEGLNIS